MKNPNTPIDAKRLREAFEEQLDWIIRRRLLEQAMDFVNRSISDAKSTAPIVNALELARQVDSLSLSHNALSGRAKGKLGSVLFYSGTQSVLRSVVNTHNIGWILSEFTPSEMGSEDQFLNALKTVSNPKIWVLTVRHYFQNNFDANISSILDTLYGSALDDTDKERVMITIFPITGDKSFSGEIVEWYAGNPYALPTMGKYANRLLLASRTELFSRIISGRTPIDTVVSISDSFHQRYITKIEQSPNNTLAELAEIARITGYAAFAALKPLEIIEKYCDIAYRRPTGQAAKAISSLLATDAKLPDLLKSRLESLRDYIDGRVPEYIDSDILEIALSNPKPPNKQLQDILSKWIGQSPSLTEFSDTLAKYPQSDITVINAIITAIWNSDVRRIFENRQNYIDTTLDNALWSSSQRKSYITECSNPDLRKALLKGSGWRRKLRKLF